jgi:hypothetical protein
MVRLETVVFRPEMIQGFDGDVAVAPGRMRVDGAAAGVGFLDKLRPTGGGDAME